jgi:hypothetical protein
MVKTRKRKLAVLSAGVLSILAIGTGIAIAAGSEDTWAVGANSAWSATSAKTTFVAGGNVVTITCTTNTGGGSSTGPGPDNPALPMNAPQFSHCKDNFGGNDTVTTNPAGWTVQFFSDTGTVGTGKCPTGTGKDETSGKDCVVLGVPQNAATVVVAGLGACKITVQPNGPTTVGASVSDLGGTKKDTFTLTKQPLQAQGCGIPVNSTSTFTGTYTLKTPNNGVLVDNS